MISSFFLPAEFEEFPQIADRFSLKQYLFHPANASFNFHADVVKYTRLSTLTRILKTRKWYLGNPRTMNDKKELSDFPQAQWERIFYSCFIANKDESIAMWALYGRPWADGLSITIRNDDFRRWMNEIRTVYYFDGHDYQILPDAELSVVQVVYTNELSKGSEEPSVLVCNGQQNRKVAGIFSMEADAHDDLYDPTTFAGAVKDVAWSYENEIRIRCDVKGDYVPDKLFIDVPDYVVHNIIITSGPLFYGNLEYRLSDMSKDPFRLKYSIFRHHLKDMPCTEYLHSVGSFISCCPEKAALEAAQSSIPSADKISLVRYSGKGTFYFPAKGTFTIGSNEHLFQIDWLHDGNNIKLKMPVGRCAFFSDLPSVKMLGYYVMSSSQLSTISDGEAVIITNQAGRVASIKFLRVNNESNSRNYELEYQIYMEPKIEIVSAEDYGKKQNEMQYAIVQDPNDSLCGTWWDMNSQRCHMSIGKKDNRYCVIIDWASSASMNTEWTMSGVWNADWNGMLCSDEQCVTTSFSENGTVQITTEYDGGSSKLILVNDELLWEDATKSTGKRCRFVKSPV